MQQVLPQQDTLVVIDVRICEVHTEYAVVVGEVRPQEEGLESVDQQLEMREVAGVAIEQAVRPARRSTDVAVAVEYQEAIVSFHGAPQPRRGLGRRNIE
jgi:RNA-binding protein YhbY